MDPQEVEAKFWVPVLLELRQRALALGAALISPRVLERNLRFDTPERQLTEKGELLRLRQAGRDTLTYKRPSDRYEIRGEWELEIDNFRTARELLEALGYQVIHCYEKYREVYQLEACSLMLDEVPYGCFVEIEGPDLESIQRICSRLQLNWDHRLQRTYLDLFQSLIEDLDERPAQATFADFAPFPGLNASLLNLPRGDQRLDTEDPGS